MKKVLVLLMVIAVFWLTGCEESELYYDGKLRPESEVEEIIADQLEVDNPSMDLEIDVYQESED
ncbi:hypothetical protein [Cytobacillus oceanisediminis]|uniref:hypothetical protein n=1 Tax=Cytobacillus oceanisediminis TaxID=665099 RepID=UPI002079202F|nr:hypothetical protein [Cytobacillus oceanisediminis]MBY0157295.1 hypothetical protein [Cytobacillus firmus]USK46254.1 hypothetical protein LIT27_10530 [Cytobacillus oceanisediminis]